MGNDEKKPKKMGRPRKVSKDAIPWTIRVEPHVKSRMVATFNLNVATDMVRGSIEALSILPDDVAKWYFQKAVEDREKFSQMVALALSEYHENQNNGDF